MALGASTASADVARAERAAIRIAADLPAYAPAAHVRFCRGEAADCAVRGFAFRPRPLALTETRRRDLETVNEAVNRKIAARPDAPGSERDVWTLAPRAGDCDDYAVTKRHLLLARGWPSRALVLAQVWTAWGELHLVLVARTADGDVVLDNLDGRLRPVAESGYRFVKIQSPRDPRAWLVAAQGA